MTNRSLIEIYAEELIKADRAYYNPCSKHNIGQTIVHRFDKAGNPGPIKGRERVCLNCTLIPVNKYTCLDPYEFPIPRIEVIIEKLMGSGFYKLSL